MNQSYAELKCETHVNIQSEHFVFLNFYDLKTEIQKKKNTYLLCWIHMKRAPGWNIGKYFITW